MKQQSEPDNSTRSSHGPFMTVPLITVPLNTVPLFALMLALFVLPGCTVGPDYHRPPLPMQEEWSVEGISWKAADEQNLEENDVQKSWWSEFQDPQLSTLLSHVRMGAYDIRTAYRRVAQADAVLTTARASLFPGIALSPSYARNRFSQTEARFPGGYITNYEVPFTLSYELDLWGKIRRSVESAEALLEASEENLAAVELGVTAQAAALYYTLRTTEKELQILRRTKETRDENLRIIRARVDTGTTDALALSRAESELAVVEADLERVLAQKAVTTNALAVLEGQTPDRFTLTAPPLECTPPHLPKVLPSELLRRRPDIRNAEALARAASADIGVAKSVFYPSFNLAALWGGSSFQASRLADTESRIWALSPGFTLPLFTGGANTANLKVAEEIYLEAVENYRRTVLTALREVEDALITVRQRERETTKIAKALHAATTATELSKTQYREGLVSYFDVVDAERQELALKRTHTTTCGEQYLATVELVRAFGSGALNLRKP